MATQTTQQMLESLNLMPIERYIIDDITGANPMILDSVLKSMSAENLYNLERGLDENPQDVFTNPFNEALNILQVSQSELYSYLLRRINSIKSNTVSGAVPQVDVSNQGVNNSGTVSVNPVQNQAIQNATEKKQIEKMQAQVMTLLQGQGIFNNTNAGASLPTVLNTNGGFTFQSGNNTATITDSQVQGMARAMGISYDQAKSILLGLGKNTGGLISATPVRSNVGLVVIGVIALIAIVFLLKK